MDDFGLLVRILENKLVSVIWLFFDEIFFFDVVKNGLKISVVIVVDIDCSREYFDKNLRWVIIMIIDIYFFIVNFLFFGSNKIL